MNESRSKINNNLNYNQEIDTLSFDLDKTNHLGNSAMLARSGVPEAHKRAADSYMIIKKIFGFPVVHSQLTLQERRYLAGFDFNELEYSTIKQINEEISFLKKWSSCRDSELQIASDKIIQIRVKELKHLIATRYVNLTNEVYSGYKALEKYFEEISKYN